MKTLTTARHELHPQAGVYLAALLTTAAVPFFSYLPFWIAAVFMSIVGWRLLSDRKGWPRIAWPLQVLLLATVSGTLLYDMNVNDYSSLECFIAWLVVLAAFKLIETVKTRDMRVLVLMVWLIGGCLQLFDQTSFHLFFGIVISLFGAIVLRALFDPEDSGTGFFTATGGIIKLFLLGLPIGLMVFFVFPRFSVRTLGLGLDGQSGASSGFSEEVDPGSVTSLAQSEEVVMRVSFPGELQLRMPDYYWRGSVLDSSEGLKWRKTLTVAQWAPTRERPGIEQVITLEPQHGRWLFALDRPVTASLVTEVPRSSIVIDPHAVLSPTREISNRIVYRVVSALGVESSTSDDGSAWLQVNGVEQWPRTAKFAQDLRAKYKNPDEFSRALLQYFQDKGFSYTLSPGTIPNNSLDFFMFQGKRGFCEHYAAAAATIFRIAGIPARVVVGFQGGAPNEIGGFLLVRNKDAHAWFEYLSPDRGWVRTDPVQVIAPDRLTGGADQYFGARATDFGLFSGVFTKGSWVVKNWYLMRQAFEAFDYSVSRFLLDFDFSVQAQWLNFGSKTWLVLTLATLFTIFLGLFVLRAIAARKGNDRDPLFELFIEARHILEERGLKLEPWHAPQSIARLAQEAKIEAADGWAEWLLDWQQRRYGPAGQHDWLTFRELRRKLHTL